MKNNTQNVEVEEASSSVAAKVNGAVANAANSKNVPMVARELFDLGAIRLKQDFAAGAPVKKALITVPVRKPGRQDFVRVHPAESHRVAIGLLMIEETNEAYAVTQAVAEELGTDVAPRLLVLATNRQGVAFLWPLRMPGEDGRFDGWGRSAMQAAEMAKEKWIRVKSNRSLGAYEVEIAAAALPEPTWPENDFAEIVEIAFKDRIIRDSTHPVIRTLRGTM